MGWEKEKEQRGERTRMRSMSYGAADRHKVALLFSLVSLAASLFHLLCLQDCVPSMTACPVQALRLDAGGRRRQQWRLVCVCVCV